MYRQLAFAGKFLHPVAEAIAFQMQAAVSICIIGPIGERNGEVEVRRYATWHFSTGIRSLITNC
jgi:hypothetical protein